MRNTRSKISQVLLATSASVNIIPKVLYDRYRFGQLDPIDINLLLVDGSVRNPEGIMFDILIKIRGCVFPVDFTVTRTKT